MVNWKSKVINEKLCWLWRGNRQQKTNTMTSSGDLTPQKLKCKIKSHSVQPWKNCSRESCQSMDSQGLPARPQACAGIPMVCWVLSENLRIHPSDMLIGFMYKGIFASSPSTGIHAAELAVPKDRCYDNSGSGCAAVVLCGVRGGTGRSAVSACVWHR